MIKMVALVYLEHILPVVEGGFCPRCPKQEFAIFRHTTASLRHKRSRVLNI